MSELYFDDFAVGDRFASKGVTLTETMILDFALVYDPQPFHIDMEAARASIFGGLIASGFQSLALSFRLVWETGVLRASSLGSPGFDELRWLKPVRPGDTLHVTWEVKEARVSQSKPDRGILRVDYQTLNQKDEVVMTFRAIHLTKRRPA